MAITDPQRPILAEREPADTPVALAEPVQLTSTDLIVAPPEALSAFAAPQAPVKGVYSLAGVETLLRQRIDTDVELKFSTYLLWSLLLSLTIVGGAIYSIVTYFRLVNRQTLHCIREQDLWQQILTAQSEYATGHHMTEATESLGRAQAMLTDLRVRETAKNPWVHAIVGPIFTLGLWSFYTWHFLTVGWREHAERHADLEQAIASAFRDLGLHNATITDVPNIPERNYWVYLGLTVITLGLFGIYWLYVVMADGNNHMKYHAFVEDQAVGMLRQLAST
jgi:Domain of unknown function (DUF4234)